MLKNRDLVVVCMLVGQQEWLYLERSAEQLLKVLRQECLLSVERGTP